jgi:hypothetical protein
MEAIEGTEADSRKVRSFKRLSGHRGRDHGICRNDGKTLALAALCNESVLSETV